MRWLAPFSTAIVTAIAVALAMAGAACSSSSERKAGPVDATTDPCLSCRIDQICVARYNGTCGASVQCIARTVDCAPSTCSADCESAYCPRPYQCQNRPPCGGESPHAFTCYGP